MSNNNSNNKSDDNKLVGKIREQAGKEAFNAVSTFAEGAAELAMASALPAGITLAATATLASDTTKSIGTASSNAGMLLPRRPYLIIRRNKDYTPSEIGHNYGFPSNSYVKLANCHGYTKVKDVHIEISCTQDERAEIESLLKQGVIL